MHPHPLVVLALLATAYASYHCYDTPIDTKCEAPAAISLDWCKPAVRDCAATTYQEIGPPLYMMMSTGHVFRSGTFGYFSNATCVAPKSHDEFHTTFFFDLEINNVTFDICAMEPPMCWMRYRVDPPDFPIVFGGLGGKYSLRHGLLRFHTYFQGFFNGTAGPQEFMLGLETCIMNPLTPWLNHCGENLQNKYAALPITKMMDD
jgi:hypothetical protein